MATSMKPMILAIASIVVLLAVGVYVLRDKTPIDAPCIVTDAALRAELPIAYCPDARYGVVPAKWILNQPPLGGTWETFNDCDKQARRFCAERHETFTKVRGHGGAQALAIGEYHYRQDTGGGHAIVVCWSDRGLMFIEPRTNLEVQLSDAERASAYFIRF